MAPTTDRADILGKLQEWARLSVAEINRLNTAVDTIRNDMVLRIGEVYTRIELRHDQTRTLIQDLDDRLRVVIQQGDDDPDGIAAVKELTATLHRIELEMMELKTKCTLWGILAGSIPALAVVLFEIFHK